MLGCVAHVGVLLLHRLLLVAVPHEALFYSAAVQCSQKDFVLGRPAASSCASRARRSSRRSASKRCWQRTCVGHVMQRCAPREHSLLFAQIAENCWSLLLQPVRLLSKDTDPADEGSLCTGHFQRDQRNEYTVNLPLKGPAKGELLHLSLQQAASRPPVTCAAPLDRHSPSSRKADEKATVAARPSLPRWDKKPLPPLSVHGKSSDCATSITEQL